MIRIANNEENVNKCIDEIAVSVDGSDCIPSIYYLEERIESLRDILNRLMPGIVKTYSPNTILKVSRTLDVLINLYYKKRK